jgi:hypothetical protein
VDDIQARAPRVGKLKIGELKEVEKNGKTVTYPSKLDYIVAKDAAGNIVRSFHDVYGEKPTAFMAVFPSNDPSEFYWEAYRRYGSGTGLACHGDGRCAIVEATGETIECPCPYAEPTVKGDKEYPPACKVVASVSLWLYEVPELGVFQIDTGSFRSVSNLKWFIRTGLPSLSGGQLAGIPIRVYVEPFQTMHDGHAATAYQWKFGLAPGMKPADVRVAAMEAVEGFCLPTGVGPALLDEAKPEDLYANEVPTAEDHQIGATATQESDYPAFVTDAETAYLNALEAAPLPEAKKNAAKALMEANREKARDFGSFDGYISWLEAQTKRIPRSES